MRTILLLTAAILPCFGQGNQNVSQTGIVDAHTATWRFPETTFASLPAAAAGNTGWRYTVTDCATSACAAGSGTIKADLRSDGSSWVLMGGSTNGTNGQVLVSNGSGGFGTPLGTGAGAGNLVQYSAGATPSITIPGGTTGSTVLQANANASGTLTFPAATGTITYTVASGTSALGTGAIASQACATVVTTTATGTASTDIIEFTPNASIKALTGYAPLTTGGLTIAAYPTTNAVNFDVCNWATGSITPSALTLNWRVAR